MGRDAWAGAWAALMLVFAVLLCASALAGPIHDAAKAGNAKQVESLIAAGTEVDQKDVAEKTALFWAADAGQMEVVRLLVAKGADVNAKDFLGLTVLAVAVRAEHDAIVALLI